MAIVEAYEPQFRFKQDYAGVERYPGSVAALAVGGQAARPDEYEPHPKVADLRRELAGEVVDAAGEQRDAWWAFRRVKLTLAPGATGVPAEVRELVRDNEAACLFNVVVALEWVPDQPYLDDLRRAFERASKLLFDVTDGYMAIGQVVVGAGDAWMRAADIQVLASNRLLPRSQVSGLLDAAKYRPVRLGRGLWSKLDHALLPWSEAYGALIHEWGHYALCLKDQYLETLTVEAAGARAGLVVPSLGLLVDSIMAGDKQTEITGGGDRPKPLARRRRALQPHDPARAAKSEWRQLSGTEPYRFLAIDPDHTPQADPPALDPIPAFLVARSAAQGRRAPLLDAGALGLSRESRRHCWVYLRRRGEGGEVLVQQGVIGDDEAGGLALLGARAGDQVVMMYRDAGGIGTVRRGSVEAVPGSVPEGLAVGVEREATPLADWPLVAAIAAGQGTGGAAQVRVVLTGGVAAATAISPLAGDPGADGAAIVDLAAGTPVAVQYFQGGSPDSGYPVHPNPIPAGSGDGNAMIFFRDAEIAEPGAASTTDYSDYRILTTTNYHVSAADGERPRSYVFGVTTTRSLADVARLRPTLILAFDKVRDGAAVGGPDPRVCRYDSAARRWEPVPGSTTFDDRAFVAAPLTAGTAPGLFGPDLAPEYFRLLER